MGNKQTQANEYLFYAQKLLRIETKCQAELDAQDLKAIHASVGLCLQRSWEAWLNELADYLNLDRLDFNDLQQSPLRDLPESQCLLTFTLDADSWLSRLLERSNMTKERQPHMSSSNNMTLLNVVQIDENGLGSSVSQSEQDILSEIVDGFKQYMQSVRSRQAEW